MEKVKSFWKPTDNSRLYPKTLSAKWNYERISAENFILQMNYGIIPFELWDEKVSDGKDPFEGFSEPARQRTKRKMRKLKKVLAHRTKVP